MALPSFEKASFTAAPDAKTGLPFSVYADLWSQPQAARPGSEAPVAAQAAGATEALKAAGLDVPNWLPQASAGQLQQIIDAALQHGEKVNFVTPGQNAAAGDKAVAPDYRIDENGNLIATGKPHKPGDPITIQVESKNGEGEAKQHSLQLQKMAIQEQIAYTKKYYPNDPARLIALMNDLDRVSKDAAADVQWQVPQTQPAPADAPPYAPGGAPDVPSGGPSGAPAGGRSGGPSGGSELPPAASEDIQRDAQRHRMDPNDTEPQFVPPDQAQPDAGDDGRRSNGVQLGDNSPSVTGFAHKLLERLGLPETQENIKFLDAWQKAEGGSADNPFNTTQNMPGATVFNHDGVKRYPSIDVGVEATAKTLTNGRYEGILNALRQGNNAHAAAVALAHTPWGTGASVARMV